MKVRGRQSILLWLALACVMAQQASGQVDSVPDSLSYDIGPVEITDRADPTWMRSVEGMAIYGAKKTELIRIDHIDANLSINNARQVFARVAGLNIWESDGGGLQLGIGGRGLSPNRTSNFNTRQNGYDIAADALGYPESYYTPPTEALQRIEVVRGAASLQYGTQFGGMVNFVFREGPRDKKFEFLTRQTGGSFGLFNSFNSVGGTLGKVNYYAFYQGKRGDGWRPNAGFRQHTAFASVNAALSARVSLGAEYTFMDYLVQQPGGLTDALFNQDPRQSIRDRNWFRVRWNLAAVTADIKLTDATRLNVRNFGLYARRDALGFLGSINRTDPGDARDLITGSFNNFGNETRLMHKFDLFGYPAAFLSGLRYYQGSTILQQGLANDGDGPDFILLNPEQPEHSDHRFPSRNVAVFAEQLINLSPKLSLTPGARFEYIRTASEGSYTERATDLAGNIIFEQTVDDNREQQRHFLLGGIGLSYKAKPKVELYGNFSQNYRAINFNDLRIRNPNFAVDQDIRDERGFNADLGARGRMGEWFEFDVSLFYLRYADRIGAVLATDTATLFPYRFRTNVSDSRSLGLEWYAEADLLRLVSGEKSRSGLSLFTNVALIDAKYVNSDEPAFEGNEVELVPPVTIKGGIRFRRDSFRTTLQFSHTAEHFSDATNATFTSNAVEGLIPAYQVTDLSMSYTWKFLQFEAGVNNLLDQIYFTRRAVSYPGPGIIPAAGRSFYLTLQARI